METSFGVRFGSVMRFLRPQLFLCHLDFRFYPGKNQKTTNARRTVILLKLKYNDLLVQVRRKIEKQKLIKEKIKLLLIEIESLKKKIDQLDRRRKKKAKDSQVD
ncbi:hypothetical protein KR222_007612 [Zaprionus bogoriensis]|nr:hypothetical protein KR222_007612 [Zaprionus bogoriensis]